MTLTASDLARCRAIRAPSEAIGAIVEEVAEACAVAPQEIYSRTRKAHIVAARDLVCFIAAREQFSSGQIARVLGMDHSSVLCAVGRERTRRRAE